MRINTDVSFIERAIQDVSRETEGPVRTERPSKGDVTGIESENMAASLVRLKDAAAAVEMLKEIQFQIAEQPGAALLAQANIDAKDVASLVG